MQELAELILLETIILPLLVLDILRQIFLLRLLHQIREERQQRQLSLTIHSVYLMSIMGKVNSVHSQYPIMGLVILKFQLLPLTIQQLEVMSVSLLEH